MTLIVYKNGILAADTRTSVVNRKPDIYTCGHCGEKEKRVMDSGKKLHVFSADDPVYFKEQRVIAVAIAGLAKKTDALVRLLYAKQDIEDVYKHYLEFQDSPEIGKSSLLIVCENNFFVINAINRDPLTVEKHPLDENYALGSGSSGAHWLHTLHPDLPAEIIINLVMAKERSVGGNIEFIDINKTPNEIQTFNKFNSKALLTKFVKMAKENTAEFLASLDKE